MCLGNIKDKIFDKEETSKISNLFNNFTYLTDTKNFNIIMKRLNREEKITNIFLSDSKVIIEDFKDYNFESNPTHADANYFHLYNKSF